jgi:hypothetical protein
VDQERIAEVVARLRVDEVSDILRAIDIFERVGIYDPLSAETLRTAILARAAELESPVAEA